jgi:hypothetical protein
MEFYAQGTSEIFKALHPFTCDHLYDLEKVKKIENFPLLGRY